METRKLKKIVFVSTIFLVMLIILTPVIFCLYNSFQKDVFFVNLEIIKSNKYYKIEFGNFTFNQYKNIINYPYIISGLINTTIYSLTISFFTTLISLPAAYAFAKFKIKGIDILFFIIVVIMMLPGQVGIVPNFIALDKLKILNTPYAVILPGIFSAFGIFLLRQYIISITDETIYAAQIDGANSFITFLYIVIPSIKNGIIVLFILSFSDVWNMVEQPLVYLSDKEYMPFSIIIREAFSINPGITFAPCIIALLPLFIIYLLLQNKLIEGISKLNILK